MGNVWYCYNAKLTAKKIKLSSFDVFEYSENFYMKPQLDQACAICEKEIDILEFFFIIIIIL